MIRTRISQAAAVAVLFCAALALTSGVAEAAPAPTQPVAPAVAAPADLQWG
ncbi:hypothetical protein [Kitasatospora nipponensis]|uniref:hypothetical protein n=1 Tax=Kitasatospora nipponensis TaxID=258049 RepID=UPI0031CE131F